MQKTHEGNAGLDGGAEPARRADILSASPFWFGFHYTSFENWLTIRKHGLTPYKIERADLQPIGGWVNGIWVWQKDPQDLSHAGTVIYHFAKKATTRVVKLMVFFDPRDRFEFALGEKFGTISFIHSGKLENLIYHDAEPAWIIKKAIPRRHVRLLATYDLVDMVKQYERGRGKAPFKTLRKTAQAELPA